MLDLLTDVSAQSISAVSRPEISRAHSAPELFYRSPSSGNALGDNAVLNYGRVYAQLLAKSPSLGYIPTVFPKDLPLDDDKSLSLSPSTSLSASDATSARTSLAHNSLPVIPQLNIASNTEDSGVEAMTVRSMLQLLQETPILEYPQEQKNLDLTESSQSAFLDGSLAYGYKSTMLSFAPSLQSHSTSVMLNNTLQLRSRPSVSHSMSFQPIPVSFKTRLSDLTALSKRVRAVSLEDSLASAINSQADGMRLHILMIMKQIHT